MMAKLRTDGFVKIDGRHIEFVDVKALQLLAHFQPLDLTRIAPPTRTLELGAAGL